MRKRACFRPQICGVWSLTGASRGLVFRLNTCLERNSINSSNMATSSEDNLTAILYKVNDIRLEQKPIPQIKDDQVLLKMACVGICGSDVHYYVHGKIGNFVVKAPMICGHEASGVVTKLGKKVTNLKIGDKVAIEPGIPCRICSFCKAGRYNLCPEMSFCATPPVDGNLSRYYAHAADFCHKLPDNVSLEEGALLEPLTVGVHACRRADVRLGSTVLITGAGPIGLVTLISAKAMGASKVIITDILQFRLDLAKKLGADHIIQVGQGETEEELVKKINSLLGDAPEKSIDCSGIESTIRLCMAVTKSGGVIVLVGMGSTEVKIPLANTLGREVDIRGLFRYYNDYPRALSIVESGKFDLKQLITHNFKLEETLEAFDVARTGKGNPVKVMIHCNK